MSAIAANGLTISRGAIVSCILALAMASSSIVFSEPAPVEALMAGFLLALCILGCGRVGLAMTANLACWLPITALGLMASSFSPDFERTLVHQSVTLFLVLCAAGIAAFVAADPEPRARLILNYYTAGIVIACVLGYIGYFDLLPGAYDLFTKYGRVRGSFKDPNVFGAAVAPALTYLCWLLLRQPARQAIVPALVVLFLAPALLLSFSRGAWVSVAVSLSVICFIALTRTRRVSDHLRMTVYAVIGLATIAATLTAVLQIPEVGELMRERASLVQGYDEGPEGRFGGQQKAIGLILDNPFGIGAHTFALRHHHEEVHNVYLSTFHYSGWLGGLLFITTMLLTFTLGMRGALRIGALQGAFAVSTAALAGLLIEGLVIDSDHWRHLFIILGLIWGLSDATAGNATGKALTAPRRWSDPVKLRIRRARLVVRPGMR